MKSYVSVGEKYEKYSSLELELLDITTSKITSFRDKETLMVEYPTDLIEKTIGKIQEGDILVVEQIDGKIVEVYSKDEEEKQRRIELLESIMKKI